MRKRINSLNTLKGVSCCVIAFLWHYLNMQPYDMGMPFAKVFGLYYMYGQYFVELFFMLSGFGMAYGYKEKIETGEKFIPYMLKRYRHLYPLFFTTLLTTTVLQILYHQISGSFFVYVCSVYHFILNLLCIQTGFLSCVQSFNGPAWCISVEIFLYLLFYATTYLTKKRKYAYTLINLFCFLIAATYIAAYLIFHYPVNHLPVFNLYVMRGVAFFYAGVILCDLNNYLNDKKQPLGVCSLFLFLLLQIVLLVSMFYFGENVHYSVLFFFLLQWPFLIFASINCRFFRKLLEVKPLLFLGKISMDIYLWHIPVQIVIKTIDKLFALNINYGSSWMWLLYVVLVLFVAAISGKIQRTKTYYFRQSVIAALFCVLVIAVSDYTGISLKPVLTGDLQYTDECTVIEMSPGTLVESSFGARKRTQLEKIEFYVITNGRQFSDEQALEVSISDSESGRPVFQTKVPLLLLTEGICSIPLMDIRLECGKNYTLRFSSYGTESNDSIALMCTNATQTEYGSIINGIETKLHLSCRIWGRKPLTIQGFIE